MNERLRRKISKELKRAVKELAFDYNGETLVDYISNEWDNAYTYCDEIDQMAEELLRYILKWDGGEKK
jgi:hypothetical protein